MIYNQIVTWTAFAILAMFFCVCGGGSGLPNFMNPFVNGKLFPDKSFPIRFGTLTQTKLQIHRGGWGRGVAAAADIPPSVFKYAQI